VEHEKVVVTDSKGRYRLPETSPGRYTLFTEKEGYLRLDRDDLVVEPHQPARFDIALPPDPCPFVPDPNRPTIDVSSR
jgi:hypothetical protein